MRAESALLAAPEVVREPDQRHGRDRRLQDADEPADERQPEAPVVRRLRAEREQDVAELSPAVQEPGRSRPVARCSSSSSSSTSSSPAARVRRHARLHAEPGRDREAGGRAGREEPLAPRAARARRSPTRAAEAARYALRDPEASALPAGEGGDREVGAGPPEDAGRRGGRRRRAAAPPAVRRARPASAPVPCRGAAAAARWRPLPRRSLRWRRSTRRRRRRPRRREEPAQLCTVPPMRSASLRAATRTVRSATGRRPAAALSAGGCRPRRCRGRRSRRRSRPRAAARAQAARRACRSRRRSTASALEHGDRTLLDPRRLDTDGGLAEAAYAGVEAGEESRGLALLRLDGGRRRRRLPSELSKRALLDEVRRQRVPEGRLPAGDELATEIAAEIPELVLADVAAEVLLPLEPARPPRAAAARGRPGREGACHRSPHDGLRPPRASSRTTPPRARRPSCPRAGPGRRPGRRSRRTPAPPAGAARGRPARRPLRPEPRSSAISPFSRSRSASSMNPRPEMPTPTRMPMTRARKTAASDATW